MKIVFDYLTKLEEQEVSYRNEMHDSLEDIGIDVIKLKSSNIKKSLDQKLKPDLFLVFSPSFGKYKLRTPKCIVFPDHVQLNKSIASKLKSFDKIVVRTRFRKLQLSNRFGIQKEKISVIYEGLLKDLDFKNIETDEREVRRILTVYRVNKPYIFFYSALDGGSHVECLIEAFAKIHQKFPDYKLLLASPEIKVGWDNKPMAESKRAREIIDLVMRTKLQRKVVFAGVIEDKHLPSVIRNADVCINLRDYERFPHSILEQLFSGACILSADNAVSKEILGNAGYIVSAKHTDSVAEGLRHLLEEKEQRKEYRKKAAQRSEIFQKQNLYKEFLDSTRTLLKQREKEKVLLVQLSKKVNFKKILKLNFIPEIYESNPRGAVSFLRELNKYRLIFVEGQITKRWLVKILFIRLFHSNGKLIGVGNLRRDGNENRFRQIFYNIFASIVFHKNIEFDHKFKDKAKILPEFINTKALNKQTQNTNMGTYIGIVLSGKVEIEEVTELIERTYENKCKYMVDEKLYKKLNTSKLDSRLMKRLIKTEGLEALSSTKIYINLSRDISQKQILQAFYNSNLCICLKTPNTIDLVHEGISGYLFEEFNIDRIAEQINVLIRNKKHLKDVGKINKQKAEEYSFEKLKKQYKSFLIEL